MRANPGAVLAAMALQSLVLVVAGRAQVKISAADALGQCAAAYRQQKALRLRAQVNVEIVEPGRPTRQAESPIGLILERPDHFQIRFGSPGAGETELEMRSDGTRLVTYRPRLKQYVEAKPPRDLGCKAFLRQPLRLPPGLFLLLNLMQADDSGNVLMSDVEGAALVRTEAVNGRPAHLVILKHAWDKVEKGLSAETQEALRGSMAELRLWIDAQDFLLRRTQVDIAPALKSLTPELAPVRFVITETFHEIQLHPALEPAVFAFTPPEGVTRVRAFSEKPSETSFIGKPVPDLTLRDLSGRPVDLASFKGKAALLVSIWSAG